MKKILSLLLCALILFCVSAPAFAANPDDIPSLKEKFADASGPEVGGVSVDYVYYTPENPGNIKLPLVIYFHGAGQGSGPRAQIEENNFPLWASDDIQRRFTGGGAHLLVPRSHEENGEHWDDKYVEIMKATIDDYIAKNEETVDITRIYVGGFSMGGKMTLKMASSYPDFFAAAFPICPAYEPSSEQIEALSDLPVWLSVSRFDIIAGYYTYSEKFWNGLCEKTNIPGDCRLSLFGRVKYPDGKNTSSNHFVWFAVANDMFTYDEGKYPNAVTTDGNGNAVELRSPDGMVSWLCRYTSAYAGEPLEPNGTLAGNPDKGGLKTENLIKALFPLVWDAVSSFFRDGFERLKGLISGR